MLTASLAQPNDREKKALESFMWILRRNEKGEPIFRNPTVGLEEAKSYTLSDKDRAWAQSFLDRYGVEAVEKRVEAFKTKRWTVSSHVRSGKQDAEVQAMKDGKKPNLGEVVPKSKGTKVVTQDDLSPMFARGEEVRVAVPKDADQRFINDAIRQAQGKERFGEFGKAAIDPANALIERTAEMGGVAGKFLNKFQPVVGEGLGSAATSMTIGLPAWGAQAITFLLDKDSQRRQNNGRDATAMDKVGAVGNLVMFFAPALKPLSTAAKASTLGANAPLGVKMALINELQNGLKSGAIDSKTIATAMMKSGIDSQYAAPLSKEVANTVLSITNTPKDDIVSALQKSLKQDDLSKTVPDAPEGIQIPKGDERDYYGHAFDPKGPLTKPRVIDESLLEPLGPKVSTVADDAAKGGTKGAQASTPTETPPGGQRPLSVQPDAVTGPSTIPTADILESAKPKAGGLGSKQSGAVSNTMIMDAVDSADSAFRNAFRGFHNFSEKLASGVEPVLDRIGRFFADIGGSHKSKIASEGAAGQQVRQELRRIFGDKSTILASNGEFLANTVKSHLGHLSKRQRAQILEDLVGRMIRGEPVTAQQQPILAAWAKINGGMIDESGRLGIRVDRYVGRDMTDTLVGEEIVFARGGERVTGTVTEVSDTGITVQANDARGSFVELGPNTLVGTRQLIDPEKFIPLYLTERAAAKLGSRKTKEFREAVNYLLETGQANTEKEAFDMIATVKGSSGVVEESGISRSKLRMPRSDVRLPEHFYEHDLLKITERHVDKAATDIAVSRMWGQDRSGLLKTLQEGGVETNAGRVQDLVDSVLGLRGVSEPFRGAKPITQNLASIAAVLKLGLTTAIRQTGQFSATVGTFGTKNTGKAIWDWATNPKSWAQMKADVRRLGGASQSQLELYARLTEDTSGLPALADKKLLLTGVKAMDHGQRFLSATAAHYAVKDALQAVAKGNKGAALRFLTEKVGFTLDDIKRIAKTGLSESDQALVVRTSEEVQGLSTRLEMSPFFLTGGGKEFFRFQSFNFLQLQNVAWMAKEAARGNPVPLARTVATSVVVGEVVADGIDLVRDAMSGEFGFDEDGRLRRRRGDWRGTELMEMGTFSEFGVRAVNNLLETGTLGMLEIPIGLYQSLDKGGISPEKRLAPTNQSLGVSAFRAMARFAKSEDDFMDKLGQAGIEFSSDESVEIRALYKAYHDGQSPRQVRPLGGGSSAAGLDIPAFKGDEIEPPVFKGIGN